MGLLFIKFMQDVTHKGRGCSARAMQDENDLHEGGGGLAARRKRKTVNYCTLRFYPDL